MKIKNFYHKIRLIFIPCKENNFRSEFLDSDFLFYFVIGILTFKIFSIIFLTNFSNSIFFADLSKISLINLVNQERVALGVHPLEENEKLNIGAYLKAKDMIEKDYFSHQSSEGVSPWYWFSVIGYNYKYAGENLAIGFIDSEEVFKGWLDSDSHKKNLLNPNYQEVGIAILKGDFRGTETTVVVQFLGYSQEKDTSVATEIKKELDFKSKETLKEEIVEEKLEKEELVKEVLALEGESKENKNILNIGITNDTKKNFFGFLYINYQNFLDIITYSTLVLVVIALLINIFIEYNVQRRDLIFRASTLIILLFFSSFLTKELIITIIPHTFYLI